MLYWQILEAAVWLYGAMSCIILGVAIQYRWPMGSVPIPPDGMVRSSRYTYLLPMTVEVMTFAPDISDDVIRQHIQTRGLREVTSSERAAFQVHYPEVDLNVPRRFLMVVS